MRKLITAIATLNGNKLFFTHRTLRLIVFSSKCGVDVFPAEQ